MRIAVFRHAEFEGLGAMAGWAESRGHRLTVTWPEREDPRPAAASAEGLLILGGPMSVYEEDRRPWLGRERQVVADFARAGRPVYGLCLGAQMLAAALGARVHPNDHREIGWHAVDLTPEGRASAVFAGWPESFPALHWHGDTFDLPSGARWLARSAATPHQAFLWGERAYGQQFHLELQPEDVRALTAACPGDLRPGPFVQTEAEMLRPERPFAALRAAQERLLDAWAGMG